jgi:hypothetical protein
LTSPPELTLAIVLAFEFQLTWLDTFWVVPSLNEACAVNCCVCPVANENETGATVIEDKDAAETVIDIVPEIPLADAVTTAVPAFRAVRIPRPLTVTIVLSELCQVAEVVSDCVVLSEYVPRAASCSAEPVASEA